jgi:hypothetical protein
VAATARSVGGEAKVSERALVHITALRTVSTPKYAKPTSK